MNMGSRVRHETITHGSSGGYVKQGETKNDKKKAYEKPVLRIVNISGGMQTLAIGCKFSFGTTAAPSAFPCVANRCSAPGS
jgi:hypothetical protein